MATIANGGTRDTAPGQGNGRRQGRGAGRQCLGHRRSQSSTSRRALSDPDGMWMVVNGSGTGGRARVAEGHRRQDRWPTQVISNQGRAAAAGWTCATTDDSRVLCTARQSAIAGSCSSNTACTDRIRLVAHHILDTFFAKQGRPSAAPRAEAGGCGFDFSTRPATAVRATIPIRRRFRLMTPDRSNRNARSRCWKDRSPRSRCDNAGEVRHGRTPLLSRRLGDARRHSRALPDRRRSDLQRDRRIQSYVMPAASPSAWSRWWCAR